MTRLGMEWGAGYGNRTRISMERFRYGMGWVWKYDKDKYGKVQVEQGVVGGYEGMESGTRVCGWKWRRWDKCRIKTMGMGVQTTAELEGEEWLRYRCMLHLHILV